MARLGNGFETRPGNEVGHCAHRFGKLSVTLSRDQQHGAIDLRKARREIKIGQSAGTGDETVKRRSGDHGLKPRQPLSGRVSQPTRGRHRSESRKPLFLHKSDTFAPLLAAARRRPCLTIRQQQAGKMVRGGCDRREPCGNPHRKTDISGALHTEPVEQFHDIRAKPVETGQR